MNDTTLPAGSYQSFISGLQGFSEDFLSIALKILTLITLKHGVRLEGEALFEMVHTADTSINFNIKLIPL